MGERWPSPQAPPALGALLRLAGVATWETPLGIRHRCRCTAPRAPGLRTLRIFPSGNDFVFRCHHCGMVDNSAGFLKQALGLRSYKELAPYLEDPAIFPAAAPRDLLGHLGRRDAILRMFERFRARLRFETSATGAASMPACYEVGSFARRIGFGDHGLALPRELAQVIPGLCLHRDLRNKTFLHVQLLRDLHGMPVCLVIFKMGAFDEGRVRQLGERIWLAPEQPALLAAPRSIEFADIGRSLVATFNPALAAELLDRMVGWRSEVWSHPAVLDPAGAPTERGFPLALLFEPEGAVGQVPCERVAIVHRPGDVPRLALALHAPAKDIRLVEYPGGPGCSGDPAGFFGDRCGVGLADGVARSLVEEAGGDAREAALLLRELSAHRGIEPSATLAASRAMARSLAGAGACVALGQHAGSALVYEVEGHRYRLANHAYHRSSGSRPACQVTNFSLDILCDQLDAAGAVVAHLLRITAGGTYADFELPAADFDDARRLWSAVCSVAAREGFPSYPTVSSNADKSRLPMVVRALQQPAPQVRTGDRLGFSGGTAFNSPGYTVAAGGMIARANIPAVAPRIVGSTPPPAPDLAELRRGFRGWLSPLGGHQLESAAAVICGTLWWLARARGGGEALLAVQSRQQLQLVAAILDLPLARRGRATRKDPGYPKVLDAGIRSRAQMLSHGDVVVGLADRHHRTCGSIAILAHDPQGMPPAPGACSAGWMPLLAHAVIGAGGVEDALDRLVAGCALGPRLASQLRAGLAYVIPPHGYAESFLDACRRCEEVREIVCRGRRFLPVESIRALAQRGFAFRRQRITREFRTLSPGPQPYFLGKRKQPVWQLPAPLRISPTGGGPRGGPSRAPLRGRALAAYQIGIVHAHLEWVSPKRLAGEFAAQPGLRQRYLSWLQPGVERRARLSGGEVLAYRSAYSVMALGCIARTMPLDYVSPFDASLVTDKIFLDHERRLSSFLDGKRRPAPGGPDVHFERFLASRDLLAPDAAAPPPSPTLCSPFHPVAVSRS